MSKNSDQITFRHKGVTITLNTNSAEFTAEVNGDLMRKPSLDAIKRHIDKAQKNAFKTFEAYASPWWRKKPPVKATVIGIRKKHSRHLSDMFICRLPGGIIDDRTHIILKEDIDKYKAYVAVKDRHDKELFALQERQEKELEKHPDPTINVKSWSEK